MNGSAKKTRTRRLKLRVAPFIAAIMAAMAIFLTGCDEDTQSETLNNPVSVSNEHETNQGEFLRENENIQSEILRESVTVSNEMELRAAMAQIGDTPTTLILAADIELYSNFIIPTGADIVLTSAGGNMFRLIATRNMDVITIEAGGFLTIENIGVTRTLVESWRDSGVYNQGTFTMFGGEIFNMNDGVRNSGTFIMYDGTISRNGRGVDVDVRATFAMYGGTISHNTLGVSAGNFTLRRSETTFIMHGGIIRNNYNGGVGLSPNGTLFVMYNGIISHNSNEPRTFGGANSGGGVIVDGYSGGGATFIMHGGKIFGNSAEVGGGVVVGKTATFAIDGGWIFDNYVDDISIQRTGIFHNNILNPNNGAIGSPPPNWTVEEVGEKDDNMTIQAPDERLVIPAEGGGFISHGRFLGEDDVGLIFLYIPYETTSFLFTDASFRDWLINEIDAYVLDEILIQPHLKEIAKSLDNLLISVGKPPFAGQIVLLSYGLYGYAQTAISFMNTWRDRRNDRNLTEALSELNGEGFVRIRITVERPFDRWDNALNHVITSRTYVFAQPHNSTDKPIMGDLMFLAMSCVIEQVYAEWGLDLRIP